MEHYIVVTRTASRVLHRLQNIRAPRTQRPSAPKRRVQLYIMKNPTGKRIEGEYVRVWRGEGVDVSSMGGRYLYLLREIGPYEKFSMKDKLLLLSLWHVN